MQDRAGPGHCQVSQDQHRRTTSGALKRDSLACAGKSRYPTGRDRGTDPNKPWTNLRAEGDRVPETLDDLDSPKSRESMRDPRRSASKNRKTSTSSSSQSSPSFPRPTFLASKNKSNASRRTMTPARSAHRGGNRAAPRTIPTISTTSCSADRMTADDQAGDDSNFSPVRVHTSTGGADISCLTCRRAQS